MGRLLDTRVRPAVDIELALRSLLQQAWADKGVRVDVSFPGVERLPSVSATRAGGAAEWPPGAIDRPRIDINAYARARQDAVNVALDTVAYLQSRERDTITFGDGVRFAFAAVDGPIGCVVGQDADTAEGIYRCVTSVALTIHQQAPTR